MEQPPRETSSQTTSDGSGREAARPREDRVAQRRVEAGIGFALGCLVVIGLVAFVTVDRLRDDAMRVERTREVIGRLDAVVANHFDAQSARRGFTASGDEAYLEPYFPAVERMPSDLEQLERLTVENPGRRQQLDTLRALVAEQIALGREIIAARRERGLGAALATMTAGEGRQINQRLRELVAGMKRAEEALLREREARAERSATMARGVIVLGSLAAFGFTGVALFALRNDFAGRRRAEQALQRSEASLVVTLQRVFDAVPVGISFVVTEPGGRKTRLINEAHLRICGLTREEVQGQETFLQITHPDDRAAQAELVGRLEAGTIDRGAIDKRYVRPDGRIAWVMLAFQRWKRPDGFCEDLSIVVDITERKEAVAQLERFFALSLDFLCISSADGYFKRVSRAVTDILGWEVSEFLAQPYLDLVHPDDRAATIAEVQKQVLAGEKVLQFENRYRHKDGSWRVLSWRSVPQPDGLMYATARDVTERNRVQAEIERLNADLRRQASQLEAANKELEAFSYSVSHDLRAPLRHIQGYVGMLTREAGTQLSEKAQRYLRTIADAGREMGQLIDDLLGFSRMGRTELREAEVDPAAMVRVVRAALELAERDRAIEWTVHPMPRVRADAAMLKQVWANLLGNAVKYTRGRTPARIEVGCAGEEGGQAIFFVRDNGAGFDMKYAEKLFGVFQRLHRADEFEGTGIGLANVRRIVMRHGGRTWAEGLPDAGATFYFTLQRADSAPPPPASVP